MTQLDLMNQNSPRTFWGLGIPDKYREMLKVALGDPSIFFPSILSHIDRSFVGVSPSLMGRLKTSEMPIVLLWQDINFPEEQVEMLKANNVLVARLGLQPIQGPLSTLRDYVQPYGFTLLLENDHEENSLLHIGDPAGFLDQYRNSNLSLINWGQRGGSVPESLTENASTPKVCVVGDDLRDTAEPLEDRLNDYATLLRRAKRAYPGHDIVFLTNGEILPSTYTSAIKSALSAMAQSADVVCADYWKTTLLDHCDAVYTRTSIAAFDAWLKGKTSLVLRDAAMAAVISGETDAEVFLANKIFKGSLFLDPVHNVILEPETVLPIIAARSELAPAPEIRPEQVWSLKDLVADTPEKGVTWSIHGDISLSKNPLETKYLSSGRLALISPPWLKTGPYLSPEISSAAATCVLALDGDAELLPELLTAEAENVLSVQRLILHPEGNHAESSRFALYRPELFMSLVTQVLKKTNATKALIVDLENPAVRMFAKACRKIGLKCCFVPYQPMTDPAQSAPVHALTAAVSLSGKAFVWNTIQKQHLLNAGMPEDRIEPVTLPRTHVATTPKSDTRQILMWMCDDLALSRAEQKKMTQFCKDLFEATAFMGYRVSFVLGDAFLRDTEDAFITEIRQSENVDYTLVGNHPQTAAEMIFDTTILVSADRAPLACAGQMGLPHIDLNESLSKKPSNGGSRFEAVRLAIIALLDQADSLEARNADTFKDALSLIEALQKPPSDIAQIPRIFNNLLDGKDALIPKTAISTIPEETWNRQQRYILGMLGVRKHQVFSTKPNPSEILDADCVLQWGIGHPSSSVKAFLAQTAKQLDLAKLILEDGFIRSVDIGLRGTPGLSVVIDDMTAFYDATKPSRIETLLNSEIQLTDAENTRAKNAIALLTSKKITKYNFAPYKAFTKPKGRRKTILVVDQRHADKSIHFGLASETSFQTMVRAALQMAHDHDIIIKTHPDANIGGRTGAITSETLTFAIDHPSVRIVTEDINPYSLIDIADKVFVVTSGLGFEALMAGKEVRCFGMPFYAGWGLTKDQISLPRRSRSRSVTDIFHFFYLKLSRYYNPIEARSCSLEDLIEHIEQVRPWSLSSPKTSLAKLSAAKDMPKTSIFADIDDLKDIQTLWAIGFEKAQYDSCQSLFPDQTIRFLPPLKEMNYANILKSEAPAFLINGTTPAPGVLTFGRQNSIPAFWLQNGFFDAPKGADTSYNTVCLDRQGLFTDGSRPSDLESLLAKMDFDADPALMKRAKNLRLSVLENGISQHNRPVLRNTSPYGEKTIDRVLILGDAAETADNLTLVQLAASENPSAQLIFRLYPNPSDVSVFSPSEIATISECCDISSIPLSVQDLFDGVNHVYTKDQRLGFDALLRGIRVTTTGHPFYAGWGLANDKSALPRRTRSLTIDQLVAGALIVYPKYIDPETGQQITAEDGIDKLAHQLKIQTLAAL